MAKRIIPSDMMTADDIRKRLVNYSIVKNIAELVPGQHIIYFEKLSTGKYRYKPGGFMTVNKSPDYLVLSNGRTNWSVQLDRHIIFVHNDFDKLMTQHEIQIAEYERRLDHLRASIHKKDIMIAKLKKMIEK